MNNTKNYDVWNNVLNEELKKYVFYIDENNLIFNGELNEVLSKFPENVVNLIVTSPPYNAGIDYSDWDDKLSPEEYFDNFVFKFLKNYKKILKPDGRYTINIPYTMSMKHYKKGHITFMAAEYYNRILKAGMNFFALIDLVEKYPHRKKMTAWGSWLKASAPWIQNPKECVLLGYNEQWKRLDKGESTMSKEEFMHIVSGLWDYQAETKGLTKANFSLDIPIKAINGFTYKDDIVMDTFIGIDISKEYCEIAVNRILNGKR